jgi:hypothetical protein
VVPLVYRRLATATDTTPPAWLERFRQQDHLNARQTLWLSVELLSIHKHLMERGLEVLPYKGPVLAESLYGNVALRQFSDLDFLVHPQDVRAIRSALAELGYKPGLRLSPAAERAYMKSGYEYTFDGAQGRNLIEIKWRILPRFYSIGFEIDNFFARAVAVNLAGQPLRTLCSQDLMLVLCVHAAKHAWMQLSWLLDIAHLARSSGLDWDALQAQAAKLGIARIMSVSFLLAHRLLGAPIPAQLKAEDDSAANALAERVLGQIVADTDFDPESVGYFRLMMELRERRADQASFLWRLWATPGAGEWSAVRLPAPLFPLYRAVRMCRMAGRMMSSASKNMS